MMRFFQLRMTTSSDDGGEIGSGSPEAPRAGKRGRPHPQARISPSLVTRIRARDVLALRELIRTTSQPLIRYGRSILGSLDDAEDIVQNIFIAVWELGDRWQPTGDPVAYLFASVRNHALDEVRRRTRAERREVRAQPLLGDSSNEIGDTHVRTILNQVIDAEEAAERIRQVTAVLATVPERQRAAYELRYRQGLPIAAVADVLGTTVKAAENLVARVTKTVLKRLRAKEIDP